MSKSNQWKRKLDIRFQCLFLMGFGGAMAVISTYALKRTLDAAAAGNIAEGPAFVFGVVLVVAMLVEGIAISALGRARLNM